MTKELMWLWLWYIVGSLMYMVKRAFYMITGPNPVANDTSQYIRVAGIPLLFRFVVDSTIFWVLFKPELVQAGLKSMGWETWAWVLMMITQFAPVALLFGLAIDPLVDWAIPTVIGRVPFLKDWWPQMPGPIPPLGPPPTPPTSPVATPPEETK